jgi:hypothetical protein
MLNIHYILGINFQCSDEQYHDPWVLIVEGDLKNSLLTSKKHRNIFYTRIEMMFEPKKGKKTLYLKTAVYATIMLEALIP